MIASFGVAVLLAVLPASFANIVPRQDSGSLASCPGYRANDVEVTASGLTASLSLAGEACNAYGTDLEELTLTVEYQSGALYPKPRPAFLTT